MSAGFQRPFGEGMLFKKRIGIRSVLSQKQRPVHDIACHDLLQQSGLAGSGRPVYGENGSGIRVVNGNIDGNLLHQGRHEFGGPFSHGSPGYVPLLCEEFPHTRFGFSGRNDGAGQVPHAFRFFIACQYIGNDFFLIVALIAEQILFDQLRQKNDIV